MNDKQFSFCWLYGLLKKNIKFLSNLTNANFKKIKHENKMLFINQAPKGIVSLNERGMNIIMSI